MMDSTIHPFRYPGTNRPCSFEPVLRTQRLTLTLWNLENDNDIADALKFHADSALASAFGRPMFQTAAQIKAYRTSTTLLPEHTPWRQAVSGPSVYFVRLTPTSPPIGVINVTSRHPRLPPDIGWGVIAAHHGRGYASEAALRVRDYFLDVFQGGFRNATPPVGLVACLNEKNVASAAVARKVGLVRMGEVLYERSEERVPVYGMEGLGMEVGDFVPSGAWRVNVFGHEPAVRRTVMEIYGQEELPERPYELVPVREGDVGEVGA